MPDDGDGEYRVLLEAAVQCAGNERTACDGSQCAAHESGTGSEDGCDRFGVDCRFGEARTSSSELYSQQRPERTAGDGEVSEEPGGRQDAGTEPASKDAGRSQHQVVRDCERHQRNERKEYPELPCDGRKD